MRMQKTRPGNRCLTPRATTATSSSSEVALATSRPISSSTCSVRACSTMAIPAAANRPPATAARLRAMSDTVSPRRGSASFTGCPRTTCTSSSELPPSFGSSTETPLSSSPRLWPNRTLPPKSWANAEFAANSDRLASHTAAGWSSVSKKARKASEAAAGTSLRAGSVFMGGRLVEVEDLCLADVRLGLVAGDLPDLPDDLRHPLRFAVDDVDRPISEVLLGELALEQLGVPHHGGERLVQLVRRGARQGDDDRVALGLLQAVLGVRQLALELHPLAQVGEDAHRRDLALALVEDGRRHVDRDALAALPDDLVAGDAQPAVAALFRAAQPHHQLARHAGRVELPDVQVPERLLRGVAAELLRALVEEDDLPLQVRGDDGVDGRVDEALEELLGLHQLLGRLAGRGDVAEGDDGGGVALVHGGREDGQDDAAALPGRRPDVNLPPHLAAADGPEQVEHQPIVGGVGEGVDVLALRLGGIRIEHLRAG